MTTDWTQTGAELLSNGRYAEAVECFDRALMQRPNDATALAKKGAALVVLRRTVEAVTCFQQAARLGHPQAAQALADGALERAANLQRK
jgi:Flp pilus assembly protein TadD